MDTASAASKLGSAALPNNNGGGVSINIDGPEGSINNDGSSDDRKLTSSHKRQLSITLASPLPTSLSPIQQLLSSSPPTENKETPHRYKGALVAVAYGMVSMFAVVVNKAVLSSWNFQFPLTMIASQMVISFLLLWTLKQCEIIHYDDWSFATAKKVYPMALAHVVNVLLGLAALNLVDIPMFGALRRTSVIFVLAMEYLVLSKTASPQVISSTLLLLLGAVVGGWADMHFDPFGYALTFCVNITTALSLVLIPKLGTAANLNAFGLMLYQITVSFPIVLFFIIVTREYEGVLDYQYLHDQSFQFAFFVSSAQIFLVNYTLFLCTQLNSPLTTTVTGTIKNIGETFLGFIFFNVPVDPVNLLGIAIGFTGSVVYSVVKYNEQQTKPKA